MVSGNWLKNMVSRRSRWYSKVTKKAGQVYLFLDFHSQFVTTFREFVTIFSMNIFNILYILNILFILNIALAGGYTDTLEIYRVTKIMRIRLTSRRPGIFYLLSLVNKIGVQLVRSAREF